jgi:hypothetical protein
MKKMALALCFVLQLITVEANTDSCVLRNKSFSNNESVTFYVFYTLAGIWVHAGNVNFSVNPEMLNNKPVHHVIGTGNTNPGYDWIYKVRDRYETYIDTATLQPYKFIRNVDEGGYKFYNNVTFNAPQGTATSTNGTFKVPPCTQDVISAIYYARNINFDKYKPGDKIPFNMFLDDKVYNIYIRYVGKETVETKFGKFRAIKFMPLLIKGTMFEGGEKMTVWVSDDGNKVPLRIDSPISVGSIKVDMVDYKNLRYNFTSLISK